MGSGRVFCWEGVHSGWQGPANAQEVHVKDMVATSHREAGAPATEIPAPAITTQPHRSFCMSVAKSNAQHYAFKTFLKLFAFLYFNFIISVSKIRNR